MHMPYTVNYNASVQQVLTPTTTMTISYVGSLGRHLVTGINNPDMPLAITIGGQQLNGPHAGAASHWARSGCRGQAQARTTHCR